MKKTRITFRGGNKIPQKDMLKSMNFFKSVPGIRADECKEYMKDPEYAFIQITNDNIYAICKLWYKNFPFLMLEPNPVTFYYSLALDSMQQAQKYQILIGNILKRDSIAQVKNSDMAVAYSTFFKVSCVCIVFSFLAIEAFMNQELPQYGPVILKHKTIKQKENIEKWYTFDEKLDKVIPEITGKDFSLKYPKQRIVITELKNLRDNLTHLKQKKGSGMTRYEDLYQSILKVDLKKMVNTTKRFINFYHPRLIQNFKYKVSPSRERNK